MIRAVLDVNVLVSALISPRGTPARILNLWREEAFAVMVSEPVLAELERVLSRPSFARKYGLTPAHATALLRGLRRFAIVTPGEHEVSAVAPDPDDDALLSCAVEGEADYLVAGDKGLLSLGSHEGVAIISPAAFVKAVAAS